MTGLESLPMPAIAWVVVVIALAGLVHGALGMGFPLVATPLIAAVTDVKTAVVLVVPPTLAVVIASIVRIGGFAATLREYWQMPLWMAAGSYLGTRLFVAIDPAPLTLLLALGIAVYLGLDLIGRSESHTIRAHRASFGAVFGLAGGLFEGTVNIAAPPLLIYFLSLGLAPSALVKALNLCFGVGKLTQLATLLATWNVPVILWLGTLPLCVVAIGTLRSGMRIRERVDAATYRRWLKIALAAMALVLVAQFALQVARG